MYFKNESDLIQAKSKIKWWGNLSILSIIIAFTACEKDKESSKAYPSLKIANQNNDSRIISSVSLVGYDFTNLSIAIGESQTFTLDKGMSGGYSDINIIVHYKYSATSESVSTKVNYKDGETTTVTLKGCISFEGCQGFYLEYIP
jgi:hypothetical protein